MYWPGMNAQMQETVENCAACAESRKRQMKGPRMEQELVTVRPWQKVGCDMFMA